MKKEIVTVGKQRVKISKIPLPDASKTEGFEFEGEEYTIEFGERFLPQVPETFCLVCKSKLMGKTVGEVYNEILHNDCVPVDARSDLGLAILTKLIEEVEGADEDICLCDAFLSQELDEDGNMENQSLFGSNADETGLFVGSFNN